MIKAWTPRSPSNRVHRVPLIVLTSTFLLAAYMPSCNEGLTESVLRQVKVAAENKGLTVEARQTAEQAATRGLGGVNSKEVAENSIGLACKANDLFGENASQYIDQSPASWEVKWRAKTLDQYMQGSSKVAEAICAVKDSGL
jgi:hypothetical protein